MTAPVPAGRTGYRERPVPGPLRRYVACAWTRGAAPRTVPSVEPVLPDGCLDIIWNGRQLLVAGPQTVPTPSAEGDFFVGVRFRPGMGPLFLGPPADGLRDRSIELARLWPNESAVVEELHRASSLDGMAAVVEQELVRRLHSIPQPDPVVEVASRAWSAGATTLTASRLAEQAGLSERQLHRRFVVAVGYGPKVLQRILRFQAFLASCRTPTLGLADLAVAAGYADQAHLNREARALSGLTPVQLRAARLHV